jgi:hypothetical protein
MYGRRPVFVIPRVGNAKNNDPSLIEPFGGAASRACAVGVGTWKHRALHYRGAPGLGTTSMLMF